MSNSLAASSNSSLRRWPTKCKNNEQLTLPFMNAVQVFYLQVPKQTKSAALKQHQKSGQNRPWISSNESKVRSWILWVAWSCCVTAKKLTTLTLGIQLGQNLDPSGETIVGACQRNQHLQSACWNMSKAVQQRTDHPPRRTDVCLFGTRIKWHDHIHGVNQPRDNDPALAHFRFDHRHQHAS